MAARRPRTLMLTDLASAAGVEAICNGSVPLGATARSITAIGRRVFTTRRVGRQCSRSDPFRRAGASHSSRSSDASEASRGRFLAHGGAIAGERGGDDVRSCAGDAVGVHGGAASPRHRQPKTAPRGYGHRLCSGASGRPSARCTPLANSSPRVNAAWTLGARSSRAALSSRSRKWHASPAPARPQKQRCRLFAAWKPLTASLRRLASTSLRPAPATTSASVGCRAPLAAVPAGVHGSTRSARTLRSPSCAAAASIVAGADRTQVVDDGCAAEGATLRPARGCSCGEAWSW